MNTQNYICKRAPDGTDFDGLANIGDFTWSRDQLGEVTALIINAPNREGGSRGIVAVPVKRGPNQTGRHWGWNGDLDKPTLSPSINWIEHWHGYLTNGELKSC